MAKGMILAAGQGTRVRPLTNDLPKAMVPILGKPVIAFLGERPSMREWIGILMVGAGVFVLAFKR